MSVRCYNFSLVLEFIIILLQTLRDCNMTSRVCSSLNFFLALPPTAVISVLIQCELLKSCASTSLRYKIRCQRLIISFVSVLLTGRSVRATFVAKTFLFFQAMALRNGFLYSCEWYPLVLNQTSGRSFCENTFRGPFEGHNCLWWRFDPFLIWFSIVPRYLRLERSGRQGLCSILPNSRQTLEFHDYGSLQEQTPFFSFSQSLRVKSYFLLDLRGF